jgi:hypothetical protein
VRSLDTELVVAVWVLGSGASFNGRTLSTAARCWRIVISEASLCL